MLKYILPAAAGAAVGFSYLGPPGAAGLAAAAIVATAIGSKVASLF